mmetsp:Transcript_8286/g.20922  ORF Transcript_8286/g.20922 Transcript_8286/m.20922 type:complete len:332 (-) Transcript_8286:1302-2297(-)
MLTWPARLQHLPTLVGSPTCIVERHVVSAAPARVQWSLPQRPPPSARRAFSSAPADRPPGARPRTASTWPARPRRLLPALAGRARRRERRFSSSAEVVCLWIASLRAASTRLGWLRSPPTQGKNAWKSRAIQVPFLLLASCLPRTPTLAEPRRPSNELCRLFPSAPASCMPSTPMRATKLPAKPRRLSPRATCRQRASCSWTPPQTMPTWPLGLQCPPTPSDSTKCIVERRASPSAAPLGCPPWKAPPPPRPAPPTCSSKAPPRTASAWPPWRRLRRLPAFARAPLSDRGQEAVSVVPASATWLAPPASTSTCLARLWRPPTPAKDRPSSA